jgi:hypothetical protein
LYNIIKSKRRLIMAKISYNKLGIAKDELNKVQTVEYND